MATRVVHVRQVLDRLEAGDPEVVYIGRAVGRYGLRASPLANPFRFSRSRGGDRYPQFQAATREEAISRFGDLMRQRLEFFPRETTEQLRALRGKTLACWCAPLACHGDVLAEMAELAV